MMIGRVLAVSHRNLWTKVDYNWYNMLLVCYAMYVCIYLVGLMVSSCYCLCVFIYVSHKQRTYVHTHFIS